MTDQDIDRLLDSPEAAEYLRTTTRHLRRLVKFGGLAVVHLGGKRRFRRQDLDMFVEAQVVGSSQHPEPASH